MKAPYGCRKKSTALKEMPAFFQSAKVGTVRVIPSKGWYESPPSEEINSPEN